MNNDYRYILDKGSKKFHCPSCNKKRFVRYVDRKEDDYLPEKYGRCDREDNCGYFLSPYENENLTTDWKPEPQQKQKKEVKYIPYELFDKSRSRYEENTFVQFLLKLFDDSAVSELIQKYHLGTSGKIRGGCIFYQIDIEGNIRRGKIMVYDSEGHKQRFGSVHNQLDIDKDCYPKWRYFGEHLLTDDKDIPIAIVESEKTAIIASVYFPEYTWIATGTKSTLKAEYCKSLIGRNVTLFPDIGAFDEWQQKAAELSYFCNINTSSLLENLADPEAQKQGYDLADYLIQFNADAFREKDNGSESKFENGYPKAWDNISLDEDSQEYIEATRHAMNDAGPDELEELCKRDPTVQKLINLFDGEIVTANELILN